MIAFVATPIGNLKDITLRALDALKEADVIFCEDTRHTLKLLSAYGISKPLKSCHKFNEREAAAKILALSREGKKVCIVSDAGMPAISDPGFEVARFLTEAGEPYTVLPGANAALSALVLSALPSARFLFVGFLPEKKKEREELLARYLHARETLLFHCAPQDVDKTVEALYAALGERRACAVREITKVHEERLFFRLSEGLPGEKRGEYVLVVEGAKEEHHAPPGLSPRDHVKMYMEQGLSKKDALKRAAADRGVPKSELYKETLDL